MRSDDYPPLNSIAPASLLKLCGPHLLMRDVKMNAEWIEPTKESEARFYPAAITEPQDGQKISSLSTAAPQSSQNPASAMATSAGAAASSSNPPQ